MALSNVKCFKQLRRNTACIPNYFKHTSLPSIVKGVSACAFPKCTHYALPRLFVHRTTCMKLSTSSSGLYNSTPSAILFVGSEIVERISYF